MKAMLKMDHSSKEKGPPQIPVDVLLDILSRLPVKTLCRFKCVSKTWLHDLLKPNSYFHKLHFRRSQQNPFFVRFDLSDTKLNEKVHISSVDHKGRSINDFTAQLKLDDDDVNRLQLLPSQGGLICATIGSQIHICNPSTQEFMELPKGSPKSSYGNAVGFEFLESTEEYKVVRLFNQRLDWNKVRNYEAGLRCEVLTLNSSSKYSLKWRALKEDFPYEIEGMSISINGSVHWKVKRRKVDDYILSFDFETEKFWILPPPLCVKVSPWFFLRALKGNLCIIEFPDSRFINNIWILKDRKENIWSKEYSIDFKTLDGFSPSGDWYGRYFDIQNEEILIETSPKRFYSYNIRSKTVKRLGSLGYSRFSAEECNYNDSFFSLEDCRRPQGSARLMFPVFGCFLGSRTRKMKGKC